MKRGFIFFVLLLSSLHVTAQQKLEAVFDDFGHLIPKNKNVIVMPFKDGLAPFMIKGENPFDYRSNRAGFVDTSMLIVIKPRYLNCSYFDSGYAVVQDSSGSYGLMNTDGKITIPAIYISIIPCDNGLYELFDKQFRITLAKATGKVIVPLGKYDGLAYQPEFTTITSACGTYPFSWTLLNYNYRVPFKKFIGVKAGKSWAIIDSTGREIARQRLTWIGIFDNYYAPFSIGKKHGVIDTTGKLTIPAKYNSVSVINGDFVVASQRKKMGLLSISNKVLIPFKYDDIKRINNTVFLVTDKGLHGIINSQNQIIVPIGDYSIERFGNGYVVTGYLNGDHKKRLFDKDGNQITDWTPVYYNYPFPTFFIGNGKGFLIYNNANKQFNHYKEIKYKKFKSNFDDYTTMIYYRDNKCGLLDTNGTEITGAIFDDVDLNTYPGYRNYTAVKFNNKWGIVNNKGKCMLKYEYDEIRMYGPGVIARKGNKYALLTNWLNAVTPFTYDEILLRYIPYRPYNSPNNQDYDEIVNQRHYYFVARMNKTWGMLGKSGQALTTFKFNSAPSFKNSRDLYIYSTTGGEQGAINFNGEEVLAQLYDLIKRDDGWRKPTKFILKKGSHYGMMNAIGKIEVPIIYDGLIRTPDDFDTDTWFVVNKQGKVGLLDSAGKIAIPCVYNKIRFYDKDKKTCFLIALKNGRYGIIDLSGNVIKPFIYDSITAMSNHLYNAVLNKKHIWFNENLTPISLPH